MRFSAYLLQNRDACYNSVDLHDSSFLFHLIWASMGASLSMGRFFLGAIAQGQVKGPWLGWKQLDFFCNTMLYMNFMCLKS